MSKMKVGKKDQKLMMLTLVRVLFLCLLRPISLLYCKDGPRIIPLPLSPFVPILINFFVG